MENQPKRTEYGIRMASMQREFENACATGDYSKATEISDVLYQFSCQHYDIIRTTLTNLEKELKQEKNPVQRIIIQKGLEEMRAAAEKFGSTLDKIVLLTAGIGE